MLTKSEKLQLMDIQDMEHSLIYDALSPAMYQQKMDEMHRLTKTMLREKEGKPAIATHIGKTEYDRRGELVGFRLESLPVIKNTILEKQL